MKGHLMKRHIFNFVIAFLIILFMLSLHIQLDIKHFNCDEVKALTGLFSSSIFKGRLTGTPENNETASYIRSWFIQNNLQPYNGNYYDSFDIVYPKRRPDTPYLRVVDNEGTIKHEFSYGIDYKEDGLNFDKNYIKLSKSNSKILDNKAIQAIDSENNAFIFYTADTQAMKFRSSFFSDSFVSMCIFISQDTLKSISSYLKSGMSIECYIPFEEKNTSSNNVIGVVEGRNKNKPPIILSAHFDHLGTDLAGNIYSGALDNASGTAFMLEMAKFTSSLGTPDRTILFVGFNAEEFGCIGSKNFVEKNKDKLKGSKVFNFDMIGSDYGIPLCIMGAANDTANTDLIKSTAALCTNEKIYYNYLFKDSSDHEYFRKNGIDAITFCDNDTSKIHTPDDTSELISINAIERCFKISSREVIKYAYGDNIFILYSKEILFYSFIFLCGIMLLSVIYNMIAGEKNN